MDVQPHTSPTRRDADPASAGASAYTPALFVEKGTCHVVFAYEVGLSIDLDQAERHITSATRRDSIKYKRRAPQVEYRPAPLRLRTVVQCISAGDFTTDATVEYVIYDFGAVSVAYRIPLRASLEHLLHLSDALYDNARLRADSRHGVEQLVATIAPAIKRPFITDLVEDYVIFQVDAVTPAVGPREFVRDHAALLAQILRAELQPLAPEEINDATSCRLSYAVDDVAIIDWNATFLLHGDVEDVIAVLEYANVELLEMRHLDDQLDVALDQSYDTFARKGAARLYNVRSRSEELRRVAEMQIDSALLFEGVNNALKLLGDQFLARVYRAVADRFHLPEWDANIIRKLSTLESIYQKLSDKRSAHRMEVLEWIIIILIAVSILITFVP